MRFIWFALAILVVVLFIYTPSIPLLFKYGAYISIAGGILAGFFIFLGISNIVNYKELIEKDNPKTSRTMPLIVAFILAIISSFLITHLSTKRVDNKFIEEGQFAKAIITGGSSETRKSRRGKRTTYKVGVEFKDTIRNKEHYISTEVTEEIFNSLHEGQEVEIKFLPEEPSVVKLMVGDENLRKFKNIENRNLNIKDIERIVFSSDIENELNYLNSISQGWQILKDEREIIFSNDLKGELLAISESGKIIFQTPNMDSFIYKNNLTESSQPLEELPSQENVFKVMRKLYENEKFYFTNVIQLSVDSQSEVERYFIIEKKE